MNRVNLNSLIDELKNDKEFFYGWQSNIAMSFYDVVVEHRKKNENRYISNAQIKELANKAAINFLNQLIRK